MTEDEAVKPPVKHHARLIIILSTIILLGIIGLILMCWFLIGNDSKFVYTDQTTLRQKLGNNKTIGIVFGGGIDNGKPKPLLEERLNTGADLLKKGIVSKLIVSGDNRHLDYNEPTAMKNYLITEKHVDGKLIQEDFAGRSTYETCERARKIFGLTKTVLISESTHLPRAVFLCRSFGIEAYGYVSDGQAAEYLHNSQALREVMARSKAIFNVYIKGENTVLGSPIKL